MAKFDGEFIYRWRVEHQMTQAQAAALLGVAAGTLRNWEQRLRTPPAQTKLLIDRLRPEDYPAIKPPAGKRPIGVRNWKRRNSPLGG
ncbi:MAG: helix-turn-helix domain-containing protein [Rhodospirillales bacterium]|nr:helix-turn-helix domain-containing protein [Rhodospirillales bacterium]